MHIRGASSYSELVTTTGTITSRVNAGELEKMLRRHLCRVNSTCLVALKKIISFDFHTVERPGISIPMDKRYAGLLKDKVPIIASGSIAGLAVNSGHSLTRL